MIQTFKEKRKSLEQFFLKIEKRIRFVLTVLILSSLMLFSTFFFFDAAWIFIPLFIVLAYALTYFSILEGIEKSEYLTLFITPVAFTVSFYLFYYLFPVRWLTRLPFVTIYAISMYAILLTSNILNVGVEKSLQLYRAAFSVNYFYLTVVVFLMSNILYSFRASFLTNGLVGGAMIFPLALQLFWTIRLNLEFEQDILYLAFFTSFVFAQAAMIFSFVPFQSSVGALLLTAVFYSTSGLTAAHLDNRLFQQTIREYLFVLGFVFAIALLTLNW